MELALKNNANKSMNVLNTNSCNNISLENCASNAINKPQIESMEQNITKGDLFNYFFILPCIPNLRLFIIDCITVV